MKFRPVIVNPARRAQVFANVIRSSPIFGDKDVQDRLRMAMTPPALRHLPDHAGRGQKSLTRIDQINKKRRFKKRATASR